MGCDIHAFAEYAEKGRDTPYWMTVGAEMNMGRDYDLFTKLAGVRGPDAHALLPVRGRPDPCSLTVKWADEKFVSDEADGESCTRENAESWVASGCSRWTDDRKVAVTDPDNHTHSWCTVEEYRRVLSAERPHGWEVAAPYFAVLAMLEELERRGCDARLVFWFDN
jgi:hypothetical protein